MPDLLQKISTKPFPCQHIPAVGLAHVLIVGGDQVEHREIAGRVIGIERSAAFGDQVIVGPRDQLGEAKVSGQAPDEIDSDLGSRFGNAEADLQFFNTAFHARSFALADDGVSQFHPAPGAEGRPDQGSVA